MATPNETPMSMTRGVSFLPGKMAVEQMAAARKREADSRWQTTEDSDDRWKRKGRKDKS